MDPSTTCGPNVGIFCRTPSPPFSNDDHDEGVAEEIQEVADAGQLALILSLIIMDSRFSED
jgi:hypothetical protein